MSSSLDFKSSGKPLTGYAWVSFDKRPARSFDIKSTIDVPDGVKVVRVACYAIEASDMYPGGIPKPLGSALIKLKPDASRKLTSISARLRGRAAGPLRVVITGAHAEEDLPPDPSSQLDELEHNLAQMTRGKKCDSRIRRRIGALHYVTRGESLVPAEPMWPPQLDAFDCSVVTAARTADRAAAALCWIDPTAASSMPYSVTANILQLMSGPYRMEDSKRYDDWSTGALLWGRNRDCEDMARDAICWVRKILQHGKALLSAVTHPLAMIAVRFVQSRLSGPAWIALCLADPHLAYAGSPPADADLSGHAFAVFEDSSSRLPFILEATALQSPYDVGAIGGKMPPGYSKERPLDHRKYCVTYALIGDDGISILSPKDDPSTIGVSGPDLIAGRYARHTTRSAAPWTPPASMIPDIGDLQHVPSAFFGAHRQYAHALKGQILTLDARPRQLPKLYPIRVAGPDERITVSKKVTALGNQFLISPVGGYWQTATYSPSLALDNC